MDQLPTASKEKFRHENASSGWSRPRVGYQRDCNGTFVSRDCPYFKINVEFQAVIRATSGLCRIEAGRGEHKHDHEDEVQQCAKGQALTVLYPGAFAYVAGKRISRFTRERFSSLSKNYGSSEPYRGPSLTMTSLQ